VQLLMIEIHRQILSNGHNRVSLISADIRISMIYTVVSINPIFIKI